MPSLLRSAPTVALCAIATAAAAIALTRTTAHADAAGARASTDLAVCDFIRLVEEVYESDRFRKPREEFEESLWPADLRAKKREMEALEARLRELDEEAPDYEEIYRQWDEISDEVWAKESEVEGVMNDRLIRDRDAAFSLVVSTATEVAEDAGYNFVAMGGRPKSIADDAETDDLYETIRFRVFLTVPVFPADADITDDVRFSLGLR